MRDGKVVRQRNALLRKPREIRITGSEIVVSVFEPDDSEAIKRLAPDPLRRCCGAQCREGEDE
jgi:hypothetical protein